MFLFLYFPEALPKEGFKFLRNLHLINYFWNSLPKVFTIVAHWWYRLFLFALQDLMHMFGRACAILDVPLDTEKKLKPEFTDYFLKDVQSYLVTSEVILLIPFYFLNHNFLVVLMLCSLFSRYSNCTTYKVSSIKFWIKKDGFNTRKFKSKSQWRLVSDSENFYRK